MKNLIHTLCIICAVIAASCDNETTSGLNDQQKKQISDTISSYMAAQEICWNNGDLECFMQHYWHSDSLLFIGKNGITNGWETTLINYKESYPDKKKMGKLTFTNEVIRFLDDQTVQVIGHWHLERDLGIGDLEGHYSLIWQTREEKWVIISDHSS